MGKFYIPHKGVYVGQFNEQQVAQGIDKMELAKVQAKTGLGYVNQQVIVKKGVAVGLKLWACRAEDFRMI